ncbi:unnamed protein product [Effrenium voratum]|nr:unnamed protein product [Effrenium voratum]
MGYFVEVFRGMGQVVFCNNSFSGILIAAALFAGDAQTGTLALLGCSSATALAKLLGQSPQNVESGLAGYNGALVGCALSVFEPGLGLWANLATQLGSPWMAPLGTAALTVVLGAATAPLAAALGPRMAPVPQWTIAFNLTVLAVLAFFALAEGKKAPPPPPEKKALDLGAWFNRPGMPVDLLEMTLQGVSQIFVVQNGFAGLMILAGIFCYSPAAAGLTFAGSLLGNLTAMFSGCDMEEVMDGLWGYNAALTSLAVGIFFVPLGREYYALACAGAVAATGATAVCKALLAKALLPPMTVPFCAVASGCFLLGNRLPGLKLARTPVSPEINHHAYHAF